MRAFIALEISEDIRNALEQIESHLKYAGADVKWVRPGLIHLTLKFLGEIADKKIEDVESALDGAARSAKPFEMTLKDIGAFPGIERPRVIWVGLDKGAAEAAELARRIENSLSDIGFPKAEKPFSPHLTIGRVRSPLNADKLIEKILSASSVADLRSTDSSRKVTSVILFQSTLTPQGPVYTKLHESGLG